MLTHKKWTSRREGSGKAAAAQGSAGSAAGRGAEEGSATMLTAHMKWSYRASTHRMLGRAGCESRFAGGCKEDGDDEGGLRGTAGGASG